MNVVALTQLTPSAVVWNEPWLTFVTENVKLELSGSVMPMLAGVNRTVPPSDTVSDAAVITGALLTMVNETLPAKTLLRLLSAAPSLAWIEKVGAVALPSCTKRTWLAARSALVNVVALTQLVPSVVAWKVP